MITLVAFLRGVNMAGHNSIKMSDLNSLFVDLGYNDVQTFIQSGNVIFSLSGNKSVQLITCEIEDAITGRFGLKVPAMLRTVDNIKNLFSVNPYLHEDGFDPAKMAVFFLHEEPTDVQIQRVSGMEFPPERFKIEGSEIFVYCPDGFGRSKLYTNFFEKKMGVTGTGRNWNTITSILNLAEK